MRFKHIIEHVMDTISASKKPIYRNPSASEFRALLDNVVPDVDFYTEKQIPGTIRGLLVPESGDVLIWDGYYATHGAIIDRYGFSGSLHLILKSGSVELLTLWRYKSLTVDSARDLISENENLKRMFRGPFKITVNP